MHGAIHIYGGTAVQRVAKAEQIFANIGLGVTENNPDILLVSKENKGTIGIHQAKEIKAYLSEKPFSHTHKGTAIYDADLLTIPAQNALLKTLEELPHYATFILCTKTQDALLPTIQSRCQKIALKGKQSEGTKDYQDFFELDKSSQFELIEELAKNEKEDIVHIMEMWLSQLETTLIRNPNLHTTYNIERIIAIKTSLEKTNINTKLALEHLVIGLK